MDGRAVTRYSLFLCCLASLSACAPQSTFHATAPAPPEFAITAAIETAAYDDIKPAAGHDDHDIIIDALPQSCAFSSFHRKHAIGYEFDDQRHLGLTISPSIDVFDPADAEIKIGLRFTKAIGGAAKKRPKCTYNGYYGLMPYAINDSFDLQNLTKSETLKTYLQERLHAREQRKKERENDNKRL